MKFPAFAFTLLAAMVLLTGCATSNTAPGLIFDTDIGNDIDDALALGEIHALQSRGECRLLAVTVSKDNRWCAPFVNAVNTFYGRAGIPIGVVHDGKTPEDSRYLIEVSKRSYRLIDETTPLPDAVDLLRQTLMKQRDGSVTIVQVGFSTNLARLIEHDADRELVRRKCKLLSMMAGNFSAARTKEYNVFKDAPSARKVLRDWPTPIVLSGFEIGAAIKYPATSIERDFNYVPEHPLKLAYELYKPMPYDRETWDLTAVLYAVRPDGQYFDLSQPGEVEVDTSDVTYFKPAPEGKCRYLINVPSQLENVRSTLIQLVSQRPPPRD